MKKRLDGAENTEIHAMDLEDGSEDAKTQQDQKVFEQQTRNA